MNISETVPFKYTAGDTHHCSGLDEIQNVQLQSQSKFFKYNYKYKLNTITQFFKSITTTINQFFKSITTTIN